jgi:elongation factor 1-beta
LPSEDDRTNFAKLTAAPEAKFGNLKAWYSLIKCFTPEVRGKWTKVEEKQKKGKKPEKKEKTPEVPKETAKPAEPAKEQKTEEVAEDDIFGNDDSVKAAKEELAAKKKADEEAAKKKEKKKEAAKSHVRFEVKIIDATTDLDKLAARIFSEIAKDGLRWEKEYTKEPFAFKIEKLIISCVIEDDKISVDDDIIEPIVAMDEEELVQSVDILSFNKL